MDAIATRSIEATPLTDELLASAEPTPRKITYVENTL